MCYLEVANAEKKIYKLSMHTEEIPNSGDTEKYYMNISGEDMLEAEKDLKLLYDKLSKFEGRDNLSESEQAEKELIMRNIENLKNIASGKAPYGFRKKEE